ncbi:hypothetical protein CWB73_02195 [Pseudoalteromonas phenolica]|uniref:Peptidase C51 domain-containing protein n=1 Tax=Pseudoalteromonas phenolica TaxID=161398 RepID=A0A5S3YXN3_9GAMM|nr:CHAP domain-containing protein [Pseudoalteromonas phenolica]TMP83305.1 hypothetical protein CWB73_02195 [Pseudoalteromonas phenolica]
MLRTNKLFTTFLISSVFSTMFASQALQAQERCGNFTSSGNPFPCCDNNKNGSELDSVDGNCTWFAWKMAKDNWGYSLEQRTSAWRWDMDHHRAQNRESGYIFSKIPKPGTVAIQDRSSKNRYGHVAWIDEVYGNQLLVKEQNCFKEEQNEDGIFRPKSDFNTYLMGLRIEDFDVSSRQVKVNRTITSEFRIRNVTRWTTYNVAELRLSIQDRNDKHLSFMKKSSDNSEAKFRPHEFGFANGGEMFGRTKTNIVKAKHSFSQKGNYRVVPQLKLWSGEIINLGYYDINVY